MKKTILHLAPLDRNVGDNALNLAIRAMLGEAFEIRHMELVGNPFGQRQFEIMQECDAIIFGGGGVIHSCSGGGSRKNRTRTGTMWNMDLDMIAALRPKIVVYSAGFNKFDGEPAPLEQMGQFLDLLDRKRSLVSLRNDLSKERLLTYFPRFGNIDVTPDPGIFCRGTLRAVEQPYALIQIACDRLDFRYPDGIARFVELINQLREVSPVPFYLIPHTLADAHVYSSLADTLKVDRVVAPGVAYARVSEAMDLYRNASFTISTRGHSQICSLGNGTPTFALSTHPKARGFMVDMGQSDAVFDYLTGDHETCVAAFSAFLERVPQIRADLVAKNRECDARIAAFNLRILDFVNGVYTPPSFVTDRSLIPELAPARLEVEEVAGRWKAPNRPVQIPNRKDVAYLPLRRKKVKAGTFRMVPGRTPVEVVPPRAAPAGDPAPQTPAPVGSRGVVISCDANYFPAVRTCIAALRRYNPELPVTFLDVGLTDEQIPIVRTLAEDYRRVGELIDLDVTTFPSHLSKAALSSLYCHYAGYEKVLYLDVDALVLGQLDPMFDALHAHTDIVGVRGGLFRRLAYGHKHITRNEIAPAGIELLQSFFQGVNLDTPAINSGCFVVWNHVSRGWMGLAQKLYPFLRYFKTADQALLNFMIEAAGLRLKLVSPIYNCMGFQLTQVRHDAQRLLTSVDLDAETCRLYLGEKRVVVAHFAGRSKPWNVTIDDPTSLAWDWHAATTEAERAQVAILSKLRRARSHEEFLAVLDRAGVAPETDYDFFIVCTALARQMDLPRTARALYLRAAALRPNSLAVKRGLCLTGGYVGDLARSIDILRQNSDLQKAQDRPMRIFREVVVKAAMGECVRLNPQTGTFNRAALLRGLARKKRLDLMRLEIQNIRRDHRDTPETLFYRSIAAGLSPAEAATRVLHLYLTRSSVLRRAENAAQRSAQTRLDAILRHVRVEIAGQRIAQFGPGTGIFVKSLAVAADALPQSLDNGLQDHFLTLPIDNADLIADKPPTEGFALVIVPSICDRVPDPASVLGMLAASLRDSGRLLVIDPINTPAAQDCLEGLMLLPPIRKLPTISFLSQSLQRLGLTLEGSWYVGGERLLMFHRTAAGALNESRLKTARESLERACRTIADALAGAVASDTGHRLDKCRDTAANTANSIAGILGAEVSSRPGFMAIADAAILTLRDEAELPPKGNATEAFARLMELTGVQVSEARDDATLPRPRIAAMPRRARDPGEGMHVAYFNSVNAGDRALCAETARLLDRAVPEINFTRVDLDKPVDDVLLGQMNSCRVVVVGGGGIFHSTARDAAISQWNISADQLDRLQTPLIYLGVGLNEFPGSDFYSTDEFRRQMTALLAHTLFFGLRERESVEMLRALIPEHSERIHYQPCPTLDMASRNMVLMTPRRVVANRTHVAVNLAFDRSAQRFGTRMAEALGTVQRIMAGLMARDYTVSMVCHCPEDRLGHALLPPDLQDRTALIDLSGADPQEIYATYLDVNLSIGMRTHAQLVPLGLGVPAISLATHEKLRRTARDINLPSWSVDLFDPECSDKVLGRADKIFASRSATSFTLADIQIGAARQTAQNTRLIRETLGMDV